MKDKVLVFGGTTEGRILSDELRKAGVPHVVSVATEYGLQILRDSGEDSIIQGRKDADQIAELIKSEAFTLVVDATHPFATLVSAEIRKACRATGVEYMRLCRDTKADAVKGSDTVYVDDIDAAITELEKADGKILLLTGSRDLQKITSGLSDISRVYARVLPDVESLKKCELAGLKGRQIIAMQGPFSAKMNEALIRETGACIILTKESGKTGGLDEKLEAAGNCGIKAIVLRNPETQDSNDKSYTLYEILARLTGEGRAGITLAGIGSGNPELFTQELEKALKSADVIFGAASVVDAIKTAGTFDVPKEPMYKGEDIIDYLNEHPQYAHPIVLYSGDVSLCSGAKKAAKVFEAAGYKVSIISGISSVNLFAKSLGIGLEDLKIVSAHGRKCNVRGQVSRNENCIILPSNTQHAEEICSSLAAVADRIVSGYELGNPEEKIFIYLSKKGCNEEKPAERNSSFQEMKALSSLPGRCLIYAHNSNARNFKPAAGLRDDEILRGNVPMTKEEIRALSMRKLALTGDAVFYDIGAGTGSVSLEAAILSPDIQVFSIEKNFDALELLKRNKEHFAVDNMEIVSGSAPDALKDLPAPTHAFIGGSGGNLKDILLAVYEKNELAKIVINAVTAETFKETMSFLEKHREISSDVIQVFVSRYKEVGSYHMADAINPVYIITLMKGEKSE